MGMRRRGFANPEPLILIAILLVLGLIFIPRIVSYFQRHGVALLIQETTRVQRAEDAFSARHHRFAPAESIDVTPPADVKVEEWQSDSTGYRLVLLSTGGKSAGRRCGTFDGGDQFRPNSH